VVAAGVGDDSTAALFIGERNNFVVGSAQLECAYRLQIFGLEEEAAMIASSVRLPEVRVDQRSTDGHAAKARLSKLDVVKGNDGSSP
jgi:hypothetical protein